MNGKNQDSTKLSSSSSGPGVIIYNVTTKVETMVADEWLQWLLDEYIPSIMNTNCFTEYKVVRLLDVDETEGPTYAIQYYAESKADYNRYIELHGSQLNRVSFQKWGDRLMEFESVMEVVK